MIGRTYAVDFKLSFLADGDREKLCKPKKTYRNPIALAREWRCLADEGLSQTSLSKVLDVSRRNVWGEAADRVFKYQGHPAVRDLVGGLIDQGVDMAYAYKPLHEQAGLGHAIINTLLSLDYDRKGFDYPVVPSIRIRWMILKSSSSPGGLKCWLTRRWICAATTTPQHR